MAIEMLRQISHVCSILPILAFNLVFVSCLEIRDESNVRCELVKATFISLNCVKVWWNATTEQRSSVQSGNRCQLRIGHSSCDEPLVQYDDGSTISTSYTLSHTFWMDIKSIGRLKGYKVCIRSTNAHGISQEEWKQETLNVNERSPPVIRSCSVSIGADVKSNRLDKSGVYVYRNGERVAFSCVVEGQPLPSVKWCKNTIECSGNASSNPAAEGLLENANEQDEGVYVAVVENRFGRVISQGIHIRQAVLEHIKADDGPTSLSHKAGDTITISCRSPHSVPEPEIGWMRTLPHDENPYPIEFSRRAVLGLDGSLTILNAEVTDSGKYICKATNRILDHSIRSKEISITVPNATFFDVQPIIQNKNQLTEETILGLAGNTVRMQCIFSGRPSPTIQWLKDSSVLADSEKHRLNDTGDGFTLTIFNVTMDDEGNYRCRAMNAQEEKSRFTIKLIVQEPPSIVLSLESMNVTEGETAVFTCLGSGIPQPTIDWKINGSSLTEEMKALLNISVSHVQSRLTFHSVNLDRSCSLQCNLTNDHGYRVSSASLNVFSPTRIQNLKYVDEKDSVTLTCEAQTDALSPLSFNWTREKTEIRSDEVFTVFPNGSLLINLTGAKEKTFYGGNYTCTAYNGLSVTSETIPVPILREAGKIVVKSEEIIRISGVVLFGVLFTVLVAILTVVVLRRRRLRKTRRSSALLGRSSGAGLVGPQVSYSSSRADSRPSGSHECLVCENDMCSGILLQNDQLKAAVRQMYIPRERIQLRNIVGKGQFGRVYYAYLRDPRDIVEEVAVKTMKYKPDELEMVELFLKEAAIMKDFQHVHVLGVRGITFDSDESPMVILPFMANGDLRRYILQPHLDITILQLLLMGLQVARGMHYLSQMRFVHRDLAARNCMVNDRGVVKVADFGLSRQLVRDYYRVESSGTTPVPVRWMAPECLEAHLFTTMSDVWSFGVLLWELMTRGAVPYPDVENWQIPNHVQSGNRLEQPLFCPDIIYEIMTGCWEVGQKQRPSFLELVESIQSIVESVKPGARESSLLYQNIVRRGKSESD